MIGVAELGVRLIKFMKSVLIALNVLAALLVILAMNVIHDLYQLRGINMYVELDRAQIIDRNKLEAAYPKQIQNDRILIPKLFFSRGYPALYIGVPCIIGFILNAFLIRIFWPKNAA